MRSGVCWLSWFLKYRPAQGLPWCEAIVGALKWRAGVFLGLALTYVTCRA